SRRPASAGRPDPGRSHDRLAARPSRACGPRRPDSSPATGRPGSGPSPRRGPPGPTRAAASPRSRCSEPPATRCRWARLRTRRGARRCNAPSLLWAVELRREESRRRLQDRVRPTQLPVLLLERLDPLRLRRGRPRAQPIVNVGLADPEPHRLDPVAELASDPLDRPMLRPQLGPQLADQPDRLSLLRIRIPTRGRLPWRLLTWHDSILVSKVRSLQVTQGDSKRSPRVVLSRSAQPETQHSTFLARNSQPMTNSSEEQVDIDGC